jgi:hypothetical protein
MEKQNLKRIAPNQLRAGQTIYRMEPGTDLPILVGIIERRITALNLPGIQHVRVVFAADTGELAGQKRAYAQNCTGERRVARLWAEVR